MGVVPRKSTKLVIQPPADPPLLVDIRGAARLLSVGPWAVRSLLWARKLKFVQIGNKFLIDPNDINTFIAENKRAA